MSKVKRPKVGDPVWVEARHTGEGKQPNGVILRVDYAEREVVVKFHEGGEREDYTFEQFEFNWTDKYGGLWRLDDI